MLPWLQADHQNHYKNKSSKQFKPVPIHVWTPAELASTKALCCSWQSSRARCVLEEPMDWADGFMVVYNISDRASFINAKNLLRQIREARLEHCKGWAAASSSILPAAFHRPFSSSGTGKGVLRRDDFGKYFSPALRGFHTELDARIISGSTSAT